MFVAMSNNLTAVKQCGEFGADGTWQRSGYEGMLCGVCEDGRYANGLSCATCEFSPEDAWALLLGVVVVAVAVVCAGTFALKRLTQPPKTRRALQAKLRRIEAEGGFAAVTEKFETLFCVQSGEEEEGADKEMTKEGLNVGLGALGIRFNEKDRDDLWIELDQDGDGSISSNEFIAFLMGMQLNPKPGSRLSFLAVLILRWWQSIRTKTVITILVGYVQLWNLLDEVPELQPPSGQDSATSRATVVPGAYLNGTTESETIFTQALAVVGNIQINALGFFQCLVGPRHYSRLSFLTLAPLVIIALVWLPFIALTLAARSQRLSRTLRTSIILWQRTTSRVALQVSGNLVSLPPPELNTFARCTHDLHMLSVPHAP